jgi:hypothetical protein
MPTDQISRYGRTIAGLIGTGDPATVNLIEELIRAGRTSLDGLDATAFGLAVAEAVTDARDLAEAGGLEAWCQAYGLAVPATRLAGPAETTVEPGDDTWCVDCLELLSAGATAVGLSHGTVCVFCAAAAVGE